MGKIFVVLIILASVAALHLQEDSADDQLVSVQVLFRHGVEKQTPKRDNLTVEEQGIRNNYFSQLTPAGLRLQYQLGKIFYKKYWMKLFGTSNVDFRDIKNQIYLRTTAEDRTSQSSQAMIFGLLENINPGTLDEKTAQFSQVPYKNYSSNTSPGLIYGQNGKNNHYVHQWEVPPGMNDFTDGDFLRMSEPSQCPMQETWFTGNFLQQYNVQILNNPNFQEAFHKFNNISRLNITMAQFGFYFERQTVRQFLGQPIDPAYTEPSVIKTSMYALYNLGYFIRHTSNQTQIKALMLGFFKELSANMNNATHPTPLNRKFYFYAIHKDAFLPFLAILQLSSVKCVYEAYLSGTETSDVNICINKLPTYGSSFAFELYKRTNGSYYLRLNYNGEYIRIPVCGGKPNCPLEQFTAWFNTWNNRTVKDLCGYTNTDCSNSVSSPIS